MKIYASPLFCFPLLLILVGINILMKYFKKKTDDTDNQ